MYCICLIEDEKALNDILKIYLSKEGFNVISYSNLTDARKAFNTKIDLWIIDIMLPDGNGFELLKDIKGANESTPIILISARGDGLDRVLGLEMGCDDYISKPFLPKELVLRSKKLIERFYKNNQISKAEVKAGNYILDLKKRSITYENKIIDLTSREYDIVLYFVNNRSIALSRDNILNNIWGDDYFGSARVVDNYIKKIRKKMPFLDIETIYGYGYRCNL
ncbi:two-component system, OmpR family, response regulator CssR [Peptoclostridium litorale DSM 5388]|uniref:Stage 0 sporulation protein A homolog n=1 Tax=Peptoclostridium litorale DSM 5388 TaxID=1121324 RepID=A0A069RA96_PEPLI|nr:response regulator transcription factor [Peptoclostridium litorale]KDR93999.1 transcriptional regulatory protein CssR [Peptoclostridium litorale DSM 5388]SIN79339.1 two-component system, OmpR family, response regulator CssR [Peptoclostridium litorale DSM 5388]